ncbi:MAG: flagellin, partial [Planctomycetota bacterium]|nr:flagellin [Planctomycetota bacterium]
MSSINTNVSSMLARRVLGQQQSMMTQTLERLSTGVSINRGSDNPAGLIASESLRAEKAAINAAIGNAERAEQMVNIAEGGLQEINNLLVELQSLVGQSANEAGLSSDERAANQQQIDSILSTIDSIASSTEFNGQKLLNGGFDYTFDNNFDDQTWTYASVNSAKFSGSNAIDVNISVQTAAEQAELYFETGAVFDADDDSDTTGTETRTVEISTSQGVQQFTFAEGTSQDDIIAALNSYGEQLGFSAAQDGTDANFIAITSTNYGSDESVRGREIQSNFGSFTTDVSVASIGDASASGVDLGALINGVQAVTNGLNARVSTGNLDLELTLDGSSAANQAGEQD